MTMKRRNLLFFPATFLSFGTVRAQGKQDGTVMAALKVEVFSDFQCPGCKQLHETALKQLRDEFVAKGKIQLVHREFPLEMHKYAREAACLACAADKLGKYGVVSDALFRDQAAWSQTGKLDDTLKRVLSPADFAKVRVLAKDPKVMAEVDADIALGKRLMTQVQTPTMVFTHKGKSQPIAGAVSYPILRRYVEMLMAQ
jgi:protein-disulfide isomerase